MIYKELILKDYHTGNPKGINFHSIPGENIENTFFIGSEIEVEPVNQEHFSIESRDSLLVKLHRLADFNWVHFEIDESLQNGFEIITQPMSLRFAKLYGFNLIRKLHKKFVENFYTGNSIRCGLHFHISRTNFRARTESILWNIFYKFKDEFIKMSNRDIRSIERFCVFPRTKDHWDQSDRYAALNLFPNNTIEYRFPSGLHKSWEWMAYAELFVGLTKYATRVSGVKTINELESFNNLISNIPDCGNYTKRLLRRL